MTFPEYRAAMLAAIAAAQTTAELDELARIQRRVHRECVRVLFGGKNG